MLTCLSALPFESSYSTRSSVCALLLFSLKFAYIWMVWWSFSFCQILETPSLMAEGSAGVKKNIFKQKPAETSAAASSCCSWWTDYWFRNFSQPYAVFCLLDRHKLNHVTGNYMLIGTCLFVCLLTWMYLALQIACLQSRSMPRYGSLYLFCFWVPRCIVARSLCLAASRKLTFVRLIRMFSSEVETEIFSVWTGGSNRSRVTK